MLNIIGLAALGLTVLCTLGFFVLWMLDKEWDSLSGFFIGMTIIFILGPPVLMNVRPERVPAYIREYGERKPEEAAAVKPGIYIIRTDRIITAAGQEVWILEYTVNGILQTIVFNSREAAEEYREYLDTVGNVYRKEEPDGAKKTER
jgi:hypothetical protein